MKTHKKFATLIAFMFCITVAQAQFGGLGKKLLEKGTDIASGGGLSKILKQPQAFNNMMHFASTPAQARQSL